MIERTGTHGILTEIRTLAGWLGLTEVTLENPGTKFYPIELVKTLGANRKAPVRVGDKIKLPFKGLLTRVIQIFKDLLNNEIWLTEFYRTHVLTDSNKQDQIDLYRSALEIWPQIVKDPQIIIYEKKKGSFHYGIQRKGKWWFVVVSEKDFRFFTIIIRSDIPKTKGRFRVIYEAPKS